jgi:hypothetical protein
VSPASLSSASSFSPTTPVSFVSSFDPAPPAHPFIDADLQYSLGDLGILIDTGTPPAPPAKEPPVPRPPPKEVLPALPPTASAENRVPSKWRNQPRAAAVQKAPTKVEPVAQVSVQADKSSTIVTPIQVPAIVLPVSPPESLPLDSPTVVPAVEVPAPEVPATEVAATIVPEPTCILENPLPAKHATQETVGSRDLEPLSISAPVEASIPEPPSSLEDVCMPSAPASISLVHSVPNNDEPLVSSPVDDCVQETTPEHTADMPPPIDVLRTVPEVPSPAPVLVESPVETVAPLAAQEARVADKEFGVLSTGRAPQPFTSRMPRRSSVASSKVPSLSRVPVATPPTLATTRSTRVASIAQDKDVAVLSELQASVRSREQRRMEREKREAAEKEREMQELREKVAAEKKIDLAELARKNTTADPESVRAEVRSWRKQRESVMVLKCTGYFEFSCALGGIDEYFAVNSEHCRHCQGPGRSRGHGQHGHHDGSRVGCRIPFAAPILRPP